MKELTLEEAREIYIELTGNTWVISTGCDLINKVYYLVEICADNTPDQELYVNVYSVKDIEEDLSEELNMEIKIKLPEGM